MQHYTDKIERVYHIQNVFHPHGGIPSCSKVNPIMGHGNKYLIDSYRRKAIQAQSESVEWYESICNAIADFCNSMYKDVERIIERNQDFFKRIEDVDRIMVLGVSFGDVDIPYFEKTLSVVNRDNITIEVSDYENENREAIVAFMQNHGIRPDQYSIIDLDAIIEPVE